MPEGMDTWIGQGGVNLSGGQKQRMCIARALVRNPKVLILDDSTSAVDMATEQRIREGLKEHCQGMTVILIAQRIHSVMEADTILVMDAGRIVQQGAHGGLLESSPDLPGHLPFPDGPGHFGKGGRVTWRSGIRYRHAGPAAATRHRACPAAGQRLRGRAETQEHVGDAQASLGPVRRGKDGSSFPYSSS